MTRGRHIAAWTTAALLIAEVASAPAAAQSGGSQRGFQRPAAERRVAQDEREPGDDDPPAPRAALPESIEERLFLAERPDSLGAAVKRHQARLLERLLRSRERLVVQRRAEAIRLLEEFVREEPERAAEMPDALLRLAELRWEDARARYIRAFEAWQRVPAENRGREPRPQYGPAIQLYDRILEHHRDFERYDLVLYMKAYALIERGEGEAALALYRRILEEHPSSRFVPDAHFALAESKFAEFDFAASLEGFERVLQFPDSELYDIALFKSAWSMWRLGRSREAATRFRQVLDLGRDRSQMSSAQRRRLRELQDEALEYLIQVFTEDERNTAQDVFRFLQEIGGEQYANRVLNRLSRTYYDQGRFERAIEAYRLLLEMDPTVPDAPRYQRTIANAFAAIGEEEQTIEALRILGRETMPGSQWARQQGDPEIVREARRMAERAVRRQALKWHEIGQRDRESRKLERAAQLYQVYLEYFRDAPKAYEIQFYLAEILFHRLERWAEAGDAYLGAARLSPQGRFTRDALYNAIGAFERVRDQQMQDCGRGGQGNRGQAQGQGQGCGETENDRKFSEAIALYVELYPNDPDLPEILFRQGRLYYDRGVYDPAVRLFGQLLERYPTNQFAEPAGELILDSFNRAQDYANIEQWARRLKTAPSFQSAEKQRRLDGLILQAMFKVGEQLAARGEHAEAANAYFRAAEEFPRDARARQAYYNAGLERQRAGDLAGAVQAYDRLIELHPGSNEGALAAWAAAQMFESIAQFRDAARYYETYATRFPQGEKAADAAYNAVLLRVTAGDNDAAVAAGQSFVERHARHEAVDEVYFFIGRAQEQAERWNEAAETYRNYVRRTRNLDRSIEAQTRLAQVLMRANNRRGVERVLEETVRNAGRNQSRLGPDGKYYAAQARYMQGDLVLAEYEAIRIEGDVAGLRQRLQRKSELLQRAAQIYADVVDYRVAEWVTAALYQIGRSFELFAEGMREAPIPAGLNEQEEQSYRDQLAMFIIPMEERALEAYDGGYQKAIELRIFNRWTQRLREALTRLNDVQYPPLREIGGEILEEPPLLPPAPLNVVRRGSDARESQIGARQRRRSRGRR